MSSCPEFTYDEKRRHTKYETQVDIRTRRTGHLANIHRFIVFTLGQFLVSSGFTTLAAVFDSRPAWVFAGCMGGLLVALLVILFAYSMYIADEVGRPDDAFIREYEAYELPAYRAKRDAITTWHLEHDFI